MPRLLSFLPINLLMLTISFVAAPPPASAKYCSLHLPKGIAIMLGEHVIQAYTEALKIYYQDQRPVCMAQGGNTYEYVQEQLAQLPHTNPSPAGAASPSAQKQTGRSARERRGKAHSAPLPEDGPVAEKPRRKAHSVPLPDQENTRKEKATKGATGHSPPHSRRRKKKEDTFLEEELKVNEAPAQKAAQSPAEGLSERHLPRSSSSAFSSLADEEFPHARSPHRGSVRKKQQHPYDYDSEDPLAEAEVRALTSPGHQSPTHHHHVAHAATASSASASALAASAAVPGPHELEPFKRLNSMEYISEEIPEIDRKMKPPAMCGYLLEHQLGNVSALKAKLRKKPGVIWDISENILAPRTIPGYYHITLCNPEDKKPWFQCSEVQKIAAETKEFNGESENLYTESLREINSTLTIKEPALYTRYLVLALEPATLTYKNKPVSDNLHLSIAKVKEMENNRVTVSAPEKFIALFEKELEKLNHHKLELSSAPLACHG